MTTRKPKIGDVVTCKHPTEAYYSNYGITPFCEFTPEDTGIVAAIAPKVRMTPKDATHDGLPDFACVDFEKNGRQWRVGLNFCNVIIVTRKA